MMNSPNIQATVPGPSSPFGRFAETLRIFSDPISYMEKQFAKYGPIVGVLTAPLTTPPSPDYPGTVFMYGPDPIREVCSDHDGYHRSAMSHRLYPANEVTARTQPLKCIMTGLAYQRGDTHRTHRRLIAPALHKQKVQTYFDATVWETQLLMDELRIGETYDMSRELFKLTLRISARTLFGLTDQANGKRIGQLIDRWVDFIMSVSHLFPFDRPGFPYHKWLNLSRDIEIATRRIINEKRASGADDDSLLSRLIRATDDDGARLSEDDLVGHISLMLWGSRDAAAAALTWALFLIPLHADVHAGIVRELDAVLAGAPPASEQIVQLPATERALKESLRILPPFPMLNRIASTHNQVGAYGIPAGTEIIMSIYHTHRMPELYSQPAAFLPQRWQTIDPQVFEYMPFGSGPRMCPGSSFAWQELMVVTAMLLQRYRFEVVDGARVDRIVKLALLPKQGLRMKLNVQDGEYAKSVKRVGGNLNEMVSTLPR
jgi:cytochrome P450